MEDLILKFALFVSAKDTQRLLTILIIGVTLICFTIVVVGNDIQFERMMKLLTLILNTKGVQ